MAIPGITSAPTLPIVGTATFEDDFAAWLYYIKNTFVPEMNLVIAAINSLGTFPDFTRYIITPASSPFAAATANEIWCDTTTGAITVELPATPNNGDIVIVVDTKGTWNTNNVTIDRNGENIDGVASDYALTLNNTRAVCLYLTGYGWVVKEY